MAVDHLAVIVGIAFVRVHQGGAKEQIERVEKDAEQIVRLHHVLHQVLIGQELHRNVNDPIGQRVRLFRNRQRVGGVGVILDKSLDS